MILTISIGIFEPESRYNDSSNIMILFCLTRCLFVFITDHSYEVEQLNSWAWNQSHLFQTPTATIIIGCSLFFISNAQCLVPLLFLLFFTASSLTFVFSGIFEFLTISWLPPQLPCSWNLLRIKCSQNQTRQSLPIRKIHLLPPACCCCCCCRIDAHVNNVED